MRKFNQEFLEETRNYQYPVGYAGAYGFIQFVMCSESGQDSNSVNINNCNYEC